MTTSKKQFITYFPNCKFRYLDLTGSGRLPIPSDTQRDDLNEQGYCAFFTPQGFEGSNSTIENCTNLNSFYVDIDKELSEEEVDKIKMILDPSFIIKTKNGQHWYWLLDEPIYRAEVTTAEWDSVKARWERIEQAIVNTISEADKKVKDIPRILRIPNQFYWKKTGDQWTKGVEGVFKIKGLYKEPAHRYSMDVIESAFPVVENSLMFGTAQTPNGEKAKKMAEAEKKNFFDRVNTEYPIEEQDSFKRLISGHPDTLPMPNCRNQALLVTATLMRQAGWGQEKALKQIEKVGWHGFESERGGLQEIRNTIDSAYRSGYTFSYKNEIIAHNMSPEEHQKIQQAYTGVLKERREQDKVRFSNYEREILACNPYLKKNEIGIIFQYRNGVYKMLSDQEVSDMVLNGLYEDMLWGYRTKKNVSDKVACLISIIPLLVVSNDQG